MKIIHLTDILTFVIGQTRNIYKFSPFNLIFQLIIIFHHLYENKGKGTLVPGKENPLTSKKYLQTPKIDHK